MNSFVLPVVVYLRAGLAVLQRQSIVGEVSMKSARSLLNSVISACKPDYSDDYYYYYFQSRKTSMC